MFRLRGSSAATLAVFTGIGAVGVLGVAVLGKPEPVQAFPKYANDEGVKCAYCHVRASGGGKRNYRGKFYKRAGLSFAGFDDKAEAAAAGEPIAPEADAKPKSLTPPGAVAATPAPVASDTPAKQPTVAQLRAKTVETATALKKTPTDAKAKKAHATALVTLAHAVAKDATVAPATRYAEALKLLRQAAPLDPTNKSIATDIKQMETAAKAGK